MVQKSLKGKVLGKDAKLSAVADRRKAVTARAKRDDTRWKRAISKMSAEKKGKFAAVQKVARRGITRRALNRKNERKADSIAYECTIHMGKNLKGRTFHKRAPTAVKKIREFAHNLMRTKDNRVDANLNNFLWSRGIKGVPKRVRVLIQRKVAEQGENASGSRKHLYSVITLVPTENFEGLLTKTVIKLQRTNIHKPKHIGNIAVDRHGALPGGGLLLGGGEGGGQPGPPRRRRAGAHRQGDVRAGVRQRRPSPRSPRPPRPRLRPLRGAREQAGGGHQHPHRRVPRAQGELRRQGR